MQNRELVEVEQPGKIHKIQNSESLLREERDAYVKSGKKQHPL